jgi:hypothetical protein
MASARKRLDDLQVAEIRRRLHVEVVQGDDGAA